MMRQHKERLRTIEEWPAGIFIAEGAGSGDVYALDLSGCNTHENDFIRPGLSIRFFLKARAGGTEPLYLLHFSPRI